MLRHPKGSHCTRAPCHCSPTLRRSQPFAGCLVGAGWSHVMAVSRGINRVNGVVVIHPGVWGVRAPRDRAQSWSTLQKQGLAPSLHCSP